MRIIIRLVKTELRAMFYSPIAWLILIVFTIQAAMSFTGKYNDALSGELAGMINSRSNTLFLFFGERGAVSSLMGYIYLYMPLITMGLMSRELNSGTIKLLNSSPMSNIQIIIGKYLSVVVYQLNFITIIFICLIPAFFIIDNIDIPVIFTGLLGVFLTLCAYVSIGLFMSCITHYQIVAAVSTLITLSFLNSIGAMGQEYDFIRDITYWLSLSGRTQVFLNGILSSQEVIYFILVVFMFLAASVNRLNGLFLSNNKIKLYSQYVALVIIVLSLGYFTSRPLMINVYDATATKTNSLTKESQEALLKAGKDLTLTTYVNVLGENSHMGMPSSIIRNNKLFEQYVRLNPHLDLRYVYYYKMTPNQTLSFYQGNNPNITEKELLELVCKNNDYDKDLFISLEEMVKQEGIDLSDESYNYVRCFQSNGRKAFLRIFNDMQMEPTEIEISTALKTLSEKSPLVGFVTGHKEREVKGFRNSDYRPLSDKGYRYSLVNNGFNIINIDLNNEVNPDVDIIVIADSRSDYNALEMQNYEKFLNRGGNMIILGDVNRQKFMNPIIDKLGLRFGNGQLVQPNKDKQDNVIYAEVTDAASKINGEFNYLKYTQTGASMPGAVSIEQIADKGFTVADILTTKSNGSWNEKNTTNFADDKAVFNPEDGEVEKLFSLMKYLTRTICNKEQRIFVIGDADCISTEELSADRRSTGVTMITYNMNGESDAPKKLNNAALLSGLFRCLSYDEYPVVVTRDQPKDIEIDITLEGISFLKILLIWVIPITLGVGYLLIWLRRRRR